MTCGATKLEPKADIRVVGDARVVKAVLDGDVDAFEVLVRRYSEDVFEVVSRRVPPDEVDGVAQEVFISAFRSLDAYEERQLFRHWLRRIARRRCCDYWRERRRQPKIMDTVCSDAQHQWLKRISIGAGQEEFEKECERREAQEVVHLALRGLTPEDRTLVECVYFEGLPLREVAATLGWSVAKTKIRAYRVRRRLRDIVERLAVADCHEGNEGRHETQS